MRVTFWGTRGSIAKAGPSTVRYGGNTSCVEVRTDSGTLLVLDCGTGAHGLGGDLSARANGAPIDGHLLISHTHWDHIQGLPFFAPVLQPGNTWSVYGPRGLGDSLCDTLAGQMQYSYFPITIDQLAAEVEYHDLVEGRFHIDDVTITAEYLNHPALTLGYRIEADGAVLVYASDHEPYDPRLAHGGDIEASRHDRDHAAFCAGADLLVHDTQYLADEYDSKKGWGHSTVEYAVDLAASVGVTQLALFHHDPGRDDAAVDDVVALARARSARHGGGTEVVAAAEGATIELRGDAPTSPTRPEFRPATRQPALEDVHRAVIVAVSDAEIAAMMREAAEAEGMEVASVTSAAAAHDAMIETSPAFVLVDDDTAGHELGRSLRTAVAGEGLEVTVVAVTRRPGDSRHGPDVADLLIWPASLGYVRTKFRAWLLRRACRWQNAPLPADEDTRLAALQGLGILDTAAEERFDRLTRRASQVLDVPIALVSLVDADRQWFKSRHGIDAEQTPRDMALCAHAILDDEVFQVPDALGDDRFADNPLVADEPRLRFYAGAPLTFSDGSRVGTLCVLDYRPRLLDDDQLAELRRLGRLVAGELESD